MHNIFVIALGTIVRQIRNKVLYLLVGLISVFVAVGAMYRVLSLGAEIRLMRNMGLAGINIIGMVVAVFIGANEIGKELREGTVDGLLAKPLGRTEFLIGKYFGTLLVAFINMFIMAACFMLIMYYYESVISFDILRGLLMNIFEVAILLSVAVFFTTFLPESVSAVFTFLVFVIGHGAHMLPIIADKVDDLAIIVIGNIAYYIFPNLHHFNLRLAVGHSLEIPLIYVITAILYGICYSLIMMYFAIAVFRLREL